MKCISQTFPPFTCTPICRPPSKKPSRNRQSQSPNPNPEISLPNFLHPPLLADPHIDNARSTLSVRTICEAHSFIHSLIHVCILILLSGNLMVGVCMLCHGKFRVYKIRCMQAYIHTCMLVFESPVRHKLGHIPDGNFISTHEVHRVHTPIY